MNLFNLLKNLKKTRRLLFLKAFLDRNLILISEENLSKEQGNALLSSFESVLECRDIVYYNLETSKKSCL